MRTEFVCTEFACTEFASTELAFTQPICTELICTEPVVLSLEKDREMPEAVQLASVFPIRRRQQQGPDVSKGNFLSDMFAMARARQALTEAGLDAQQPLQRASSVTNEVWITPDYVVRVNRRMSPRLYREAILGPQLPSEVGYPEIIAYGGQTGKDWLILKRMPGEMLSKCWPTMSQQDRRSAIRQVASMIRRLHETPTPVDLPGADGAPHLIDPTQLPIVSPLLNALHQLEQDGRVDRGLIADTMHLVLASTPALDSFPTSTLIHGDLHFQNILWSDGTISALLDFEWCRGAPADLDLDVLLRFCCHPEWYVAPDYEAATHAYDYSDVVHWFKEDYPELFELPFAFERLLMYEISYDVHDLLCDVRTGKPDSALTTHVSDLPQWHPKRRLADALRGSSHLHQLAGISFWNEPGSAIGSGSEPPLSFH